MQNNHNLLSDMLPREDTARQLRVHWRTLKRWDDIGKGPPVTYVGRVPYYRAESLRQWIIAQERRPAPPEPVRRGRPRQARASDKNRAGADEHRHFN